MRGTNIITINGRPYDAITGMPVKNSAQAKPAVNLTPAHKSVTPATSGRVMSDVGPKPARQTMEPIAKTAAPIPSVKPQTSRQPHPGAHHIHKKTQRSQTLNRAALKRPHAKPVSQSAPVKRSEMISRFSPSHQQTLAKQATTQSAPVAKPQHKTHPVVPKRSPAVSKQPLQGSALKEHLIKQQLDRESEQVEAQKPKLKERVARRKPRIATIFSGIAALVVLGGYLTYLNLPSLSIRVAAAQAGVDASYPTYQPSGYSFAGPVAYSPGEVRVDFASNTNEYKYSLIQKSSSWDSQAVLDNYVLQETEQYATLQERGLTIYLMRNKAAWVNGGVLHVIDGNAPLSSEQIQKIASSTL